jgi:hypothetical protein
MSRYRPFARLLGRSVTTPAASAARATVRRSASAGSLPARNWTSVPVTGPSVICAEVIVTGLPMSSSRPVPGLRLPKPAVVYQWVCHAAAGEPPIASRASWGLSPSLSPRGPNAATLTGASAWAATEGRAPAAADGRCRASTPRTASQPPAASTARTMMAVVSLISRRAVLDRGGRADALLVGSVGAGLAGCAGTSSPLSDGPDRPGWMSSPSSITSWAGLRIGGVPSLASPDSARQVTESIPAGMPGRSRPGRGIWPPVCGAGGSAACSSPGQYPVSAA